MCPFFLSYNGVGVIYVGPIVSFSSVPRTMECALDVPLALLYHFYCWRIRDCIYHTMKCPLQMPTTWIHKWYWSKFSNDPVHTVHILKVLSGQVYSQISNQLWNIACSSLFSQWSQSAYCQYLTGRSWTLSTRFKHFGVFHDPTVWKKIYAGFRPRVQLTRQSLLAGLCNHACMKKNNGRNHGEKTTGKAFAHYIMVSVYWISSKNIW